MSVENLDNHKAKFCECGSVNFNLLKSGLIECSCCGKREGNWVESLESRDMERDAKFLYAAVKGNDHRQAKYIRKLANARADGSWKPELGD